MQKLHTTLGCVEKSMWAGPTTRGPNRNYFYVSRETFFAIPPLASRGPRHTL